MGPRVGSGVQLTYRAVVTTTVGGMAAEAPRDDRPLARHRLDRDYAEGAAYREYFATDRLMFEVPALDDRLNSKDEVLVLRVADASGVRQPPCDCHRLSRQPLTASS